MLLRSVSNVYLNIIILSVDLISCCLLECYVQMLICKAAVVLHVTLRLVHVSHNCLFKDIVGAIHEWIVWAVCEIRVHKTMYNLM